MAIENQTISPTEFILWFSHKKMSRGGRNGERYRLCKTANAAWLFLDTYIDDFPGKPLAYHDVLTDKAVYSPSCASPTDLMSNGLYSACGNEGQPYLIWSDMPAQYRIQVWGHLSASPRLLWYWDATVTKLDSVEADCLTPRARAPAVRVQEAWWSHFKESSPGTWELGTGDIDPQGGTPTGHDVHYGRTVWHGADKIPYLMMGPSAGAADAVWCVDKISHSSGQ